MRKICHFLLLSCLFVSVIGGVSGFQANVPEIMKNEDPTPVILISLESVRSHNIGPCYGYERNTAPNICSVAEDGVLFEKTYSQGTATTVAIPSLVTGDLPVAVGRNDLTNPVIEGSYSIIEIMNDRGYDTMGFMDPLERKLIKSDLISNLDKLNGWKGYDRSNIPRFVEKNEKTFVWAFSRDTTHKPYWPDQKYRKWDDLGEDYVTEEIIDSEENLQRSNMSRQDLIDLYDESILTEDAKIGSLIRGLKERGVYNKSLIVITGDHGESFGRDGNFGHGDDPVEEQTRVPLIVKMPDNEYSGTRIDSPVRHIDLVPTIQDSLGIETGREIEGSSLLPLMKGEKVELDIISSSYPLSVYRLSEDGYKLQIENPKESCVDDKTFKKQLFEIGNESSEPKEATDKSEGLNENLTTTLCQKFNSGYNTRFENLRSVENNDNRLTGLEADYNYLYESIISEIMDITSYLDRKIPLNLFLDDVNTTEKELDDKDDQESELSEVLVSIKPPRWAESVDEPPYEALKSDFCQIAKLSFQSKTSPPFEVCLNEGGFRDKNYSREKPSGTYRIIALGDAVTFGVGVNSSQTWPNQLEKQLDSGSEKNFQVLNFGFPFRTTSEEVQWFEYANGVDYEPDLVILEYMAGDAQNRTKVEKLSKEIKTNLPENLSIQERNRKASREAVIREKINREKMPVEEEMKTVRPYFDRLNNLSDSNNFEVLVMYYSKGGTAISKRHIPYIEEYAENKGWYFMLSSFENAPENYTFSNSHLRPSGNDLMTSKVKQKLEEDVLTDEG